MRKILLFIAKLFHINLIETKEIIVEKEIIKYVDKEIIKYINSENEYINDNLIIKGELHVNGDVVCYNKNEII